MGGGLQLLETIDFVEVGEDIQQQNCLVRLLAEVDFGIWF